jgi:hypothetical protein
MKVPFTFDYLGFSNAFDFRFCLPLALLSFLEGMLLELPHKLKLGSNGISLSHTR